MVFDKVECRFLHRALNFLDERKCYFIYQQKKKMHVFDYKKVGKVTDKSCNVINIEGRELLTD